MRNAIRVEWHPTQVTIFVAEFVRREIVVVRGANQRFLVGKTSEDDANL